MSSTIPDPLPGINFDAPGNYVWYKFIAVAELAPDLFYTRDRYHPKETDLYVSNI